MGMEPPKSSLIRIDLRGFYKNSSVNCSGPHVTSFLPVDVAAVVAPLKLKNSAIVISQW